MNIESTLRSRLPDRANHRERIFRDGGDQPFHQHPHDVGIRAKQRHACRQSGPSEDRECCCCSGRPQPASRISSDFWSRAAGDFPFGRIPSRIHNFWVVKDPQQRMAERVNFI